MSAEARVETVIPPETVVVFIAGMLAVAARISATWSEPEDCAKRAWDIYDAVFIEADERYKEEEDGETKGRGARDS